VFNRFNNWSKRGLWNHLFKEIQVDPHPDGSILDGSIVRAHLDAAGGKGGSKSMLWVTLEEVFLQKFTPSSTPKGAQGTSS
jgi:hypothetical protein